MKPLIIGEAPSKHGDPDKPIEGKIGNRLAHAGGITFEDYMACFERVNLLHVRQEYSGKGSAFNKAEALEHANKLQKQFVAGRTILLLGKRVAEAFGLNGDYFDVHFVNDAHVYVIPHPSGVNRWWNDPENRSRMEEFMHEVIGGMK